MMNIEKKLEELVKKYAEVDNVPEHLEGVNLINDLEYNSLSIVSLYAEIEEEFSVSFDDADVIDLYSDYSKLLTYVKEQVQSNE